MDTLTEVFDTLLASVVAVIEKDTLFHCVAEQIVERLPEGRRHFGHLCQGPQRVVCGDGGDADPCVALGDCAHLSKGVEHTSTHLQRWRMDLVFLKYRTYGYDIARHAVRNSRVGGVTGLATSMAPCPTSWVRIVLSASYRSQTSEEAAAAFDDASAPERLETVLAWLEESGVGAVKTVEEAGIPKKALWRAVSSLPGFGGGGRAMSIRYKCNSQAEAVWCAYVKHVGEGPLSQMGKPGLLVNLQEVGACEGTPTFGDGFVERLDRLTDWDRNFLATLLSVGAQTRLHSQDLQVHIKSGNILLTL
jgi:hypothetical protein